MADFEFGEKTNPSALQKELQGKLEWLEKRVEKKSFILGTLTTINEKNTELLKKLEVCEQELGAALADGWNKGERGYPADFSALLRAELDQMKALEAKPSGGSHEA